MKKEGKKESEEGKDEGRDEGREGKCGRERWKGKEGRKIMVRV